MLMWVTREGWGRARLDRALLRSGEIYLTIRTTPQPISLGLLWKTALVQTPATRQRGPVERKKKETFVCHVTLPARIVDQPLGLRERRGELWLHPRGCKLVFGNWACAGTGTGARAGPAAKVVARGQSALPAALGCVPNVVVTLSGLDDAARVEEPTQGDVEEEGSQREAHCWTQAAPTDRSHGEEGLRQHGEKGSKGALENEAAPAQRFVWFEPWVSNAPAFKEN